MSATARSHRHDELNLLRSVALDDTSEHHGYFWPNLNWGSTMVLPRLVPREVLVASYPVSRITSFEVVDGEQVGLATVTSVPGRDDSGMFFITNEQVAAGVVKDGYATGVALPQDLIDVIIYRQEARDQLAVRLTIRADRSEDCVGIELTLKIPGEHQAAAIKTIRDYSILGLIRNRPWIVGDEARKRLQTIIDEPPTPPESRWRRALKSNGVKFDFATCSPSQRYFRDLSLSQKLEYWDERFLPPDSTESPVHLYPLESFWPDPFSERRVRFVYNGVWTQHLGDQFRTQPEFSTLGPLLQLERASSSWDGFETESSSWAEAEIYPAAPISVPTELLHKFEARGIRSSPLPIAHQDVWGKVTQVGTRLVSPIRAQWESTHELREGGWLVVNDAGLTVYGRRSPASAPQKDEKTIASKVFGFFEKADSASDWLHADTALFRVGERLLDRNRRRAESKELMAEREAAHDAYLDAARTILWDIPWEWISRWRIQELAVSRHLRLDLDIRCSAPRGDYLTAARISGEVANDLALEGLASRLSERIPSQLVCSVLGRRVFQGVAQGPTGAFRPTILWSQQSEVPT